MKTYPLTLQDLINLHHSKVTFTRQNQIVNSCWQVQAGVCESRNNSCQTVALRTLHYSRNKCTYMHDYLCIFIFSILEFSRLNVGPGINAGSTGPSLK